MRTVVVVVLLISACSDNKPTKATDKPVGANALCVRGVTHVMELMAADSKAHNAVPSPDEQRVIDSVTQASITQCQSEGLTQAQLDCLLAATDFEKFKQVGTCAAIQAKRPSWLIGL